MNPTYIGSLIVKPIGNQYGVFANAPIYRSTFIEACAWIPVNKKTQILLEKNKSNLCNYLFINPDGVKYEDELSKKLLELDLQKKLDQGIITSTQFKELLINYINPNHMLDLDTHAILLGNGSIYRTSLTPNISWEYDDISKLYKFFAVENIKPGQELTYLTKG